MSDSEDKAYNDVRAAMQRVYMDRVRRYAESVLDDVLDGTLEDVDGLETRIHEDTDSALTYYWSAYLTVFATGQNDAWEDTYGSLSELAEGLDSESALITRLAYHAFLQDLREDLTRLVGEYGDYRDKVPEGFDLWDAETWRKDGE